MAEERDGRRVLAIDPGTKRWGLAMSDPLGATAQGLETFAAGGVRAFLDHLGDLIAAHGVGMIVIGEPSSMAGGEIEGTVRSQELAAAIEARFGAAVVLRDERMTSREAERTLAAGERRSGKADIDRLAAVLLLQSYLDERSGS